MGENPVTTTRPTPDHVEPGEITVLRTLGDQLLAEGRAAHSGRAARTRGESLLAYAAFSLHTDDQRWPQPSHSRSAHKITVYDWSTRSS